MSNDMEDLTLSPAGIDKVSLHCEKDLTEAGVDKKEILRLRIAVEEILGVWLERLGGAKMKCKTVKNFFGNYVEIAVEGPRIDIQEGDLDRQFLFVNKLISGAAIAPVYSYGDGLNVLTIGFPKKIKIGRMAQVFIAIAAAMICGYIGRMILPSDIQNAVLSIAKMLFKRMNELLVAIASLIVFFSVCNSITSFGDLSFLGRIGRRTAKVLLFVSFLSVALVFSVFCFFIPIEGLGGGGVQGAFINGVNEVVKLFVDILPPDVVSPFMKGHIMQILFLGVSLGAIILWCGDRTIAVRDLMEESGEIVRTAMSFYLRYIPVLVFLSIFNLIFIRVPRGSVAIGLMFVLNIVAYHLILLVLFIASVIYFRVKPRILFKKLLQIYLTAFLSCSSHAGLMLILDNSERIIGIRKSYSDFANSISYIVFKPIHMISYLVYVILSAEIFNLSISAEFLLIALLFSFFLSMSASTIAMLPVLFLQLGIPEEALAVVIVANSIIGFFKSAPGLVCSLFGTIFCAEINGMLDKDVLRSNVDLSELKM